MVLGLVTQNFLIRLHEVGVGLTGDQAAVMSCIHLYNASQQSGQMPESLSE